MFNCSVSHGAALINLLKMQKLHFLFFYFAGVILQCFITAIKYVCVDENILETLAVDKITNLLEAIRFQWQREESTLIYLAVVAWCHASLGGQGWVGRQRVAVLPSYLWTLIFFLRKT